MIGQSADDLGVNADSIVSSCTSFLFLKDATFNRKRYEELFKMNEQQIPGDVASAIYQSDRAARRQGQTKGPPSSCRCRDSLGPRRRRHDLLQSSGLNETDRSLICDVKTPMAETTDFRSQRAHPGTLLSS